MTMDKECLETQQGSFDLGENSVATEKQSKPQAATWEELQAWAGQPLDAAFTDRDFEHAWSERLRLKLLYQADGPDTVIAAICLLDVEPAVLRLCLYDDLAAACQAIAPIASGKRALKLDCSSADMRIGATVMVREVSTRILGQLLIELDHRHDITETPPSWRK
jgi:hypothetical protein